MTDAAHLLKKKSRLQIGMEQSPFRYDAAYRLPRNKTGEKRKKGRTGIFSGDGPAGSAAMWTMETRRDGFLNPMNNLHGYLSCSKIIVRLVLKVKPFGGGNNMWWKSSEGMSGHECKSRWRVLSPDTMRHSIYFKSCHSNSIFPVSDYRYLKASKYQVQKITSSFWSWYGVLCVLFFVRHYRILSSYNRSISNLRSEIDLNYINSPLIISPVVL